MPALAHTCRGRAEASLWGMAMWLLIACLAVLACAAVAATPAVVHLRYTFRDGRHVARVELVLFFGLWRRHWRVPQGAPASGSHGAPFTARVTRATVPGPAPRRRPGAGARPPVGRALAYLRWRVALRRLRLHLALGVGDPALSAIGAGCTQLLAGTACALLPAYFHIPRDFRAVVRAEPDYRRVRLALRLRCIVATSFGHLIVAVLLALIQQGRAALER